jgi:ribosomal protein S27AE
MEFRYLINFDSITENLPMKNNTCPKCGSNNVIKVPGSVGAHASGNNILLGMSIFSAVKVTRYVCGRCGFSEEWVDDQEGLEKLKQKFGAQSK